jgi:hypothetical protein
VSAVAAGKEQDVKREINDAPGEGQQLLAGGPIAERFRVCGGQAVGGRRIGAGTRGRDLSHQRHKENDSDAQNAVPAG